MGSYITLDLERFQIDWGKNFGFRNHSALFLATDWASATYYYADDVQEANPAYVRKLRDMVRRLDLLGHTIDACRQRYESATRDVQAEHPDVDLSFPTFCEALWSIDLSRSSLDAEREEDTERLYSLHLSEWSELAIAVFRQPKFREMAEVLTATIVHNDANVFDVISPYDVLRILAEDASKRDENVIWRVYDIIDGGYADEKDLHVGLAAEQRRLIVTEGSSDSSILEASLRQLFPDVAEFFDFVDMKEHYPFTGTGNLINFCKGLAKIRVLNKILFILDNDTVGRDAERRLRSLSLPENIRIMLLPELEELRYFRTMGPSGGAFEDVNGRACAIECFLDLSFGSGELPAVRWTSYSPVMNAYQGELVGKERFTKSFFENHAAGAYNVTKLTRLWEHIFRVCSV